jgi:hypothetical protein
VNGRAQSRRFLVVAASLLVFAAVALFGRALFFGYTFAERDLGAFYYPAKWLLAPLAKAVGGIPLWNPFFASGQPFAGNPEHELFHPLTALFFVLPFEWAFRLQVILPPVLGVLCMFWFLRVLGRSRPAALAGGLGFGLGGFALSATCLLPELFTAVPMPLTLGCAVLVYRRPTVGRVVGLSFSLALQCLASEPGTLLALVPLLPAALLAESPHARRAGVVYLGVGLGLGVVIAAAALLPALHHAGRTIRAAGLSDAMANEWSMPPVRIFELLSPHVLGHVDRNNLGRYWGRGYYGAQQFGFYYSLYPGLLLGLLAIWAWSSRRRALWPWGGAALLGYLVALGERFPLWPLLRHLPGLSGIRFPEKAALLFFFPTVVAGSHAFDWLVMGRVRLRGFLGWALGSVAAAGLLLAAALALGSSKLGRGFATGDAIRDALRMSVVALALGLLLWIARGWRRQQRGLLLCGMLCLDLVAVGRDLVPTVPVTALATPPAFLRPLLRPDGGPIVEVLFAAKSRGFAFAAARVEVVDGAAGWQAKVKELGDEVVTTAVVESTELPVFANPPGPAEVRLRRTSPEDFVMQVDAKGPNPSFVAVNQTWDPSWHVTLDGKPERLLRTDLALSGVIVPPGGHRVEFAYRDAWVSAGVASSGIAAACALLALLLARRRARRQTS